MKIEKILITVIISIVLIPLASLSAKGECKCKPEIILESSDLNVFDKANLVFPITITPFQGKKINILDGKVTDESGAPVAKVTFQAEDEIAGSTTTMVAGGGGKRQYRAIVDKELPPGKYKVELTHRLSGNTKTEIADLRVWKTGLTESSERKINNDLDYVYYANMFLQLTAEPSSGNKIPSRQFRIYLNTDLESQRPPVERLSVASDNAIRLSCKARTATLKITWVQPLTGYEIDIFPSKTIEIRQQYPRINPADQSPNVTPIAANKMRVTVRNIKIAPASDGSEQSSFAEIKASVGAKVSFLGGITGSVLAKEPTIEKEGDNYTVSFDFTYHVAPGTDILHGIASFSLQAQSINNCNGKTSRPDEKTINVNINKELYNELSRIYFKKSLKERIALEYYREGFYCSDSGKYKQAIKYYNEAIDLKPDYHEAWYMKGFCYKIITDYDEAISCFENSLKIRPNYHFS